MTMSRKPILMTTAGWLILASIATLGFKQSALVWAFNLNDIFLMAGTAFLFAGYLFRESPLPFPRRTTVWFGVGILTIVAGTLYVIVTHEGFAPVALKEYLRMAACIATVGGVYVLSRFDESFAKKSLYALALPSVLTPLIVYLPNRLLPLVLDESLTRFAGFLVDPNYFASIQILSAFALLAVSFTMPSGKKVWAAIPGMILFSLTVGTILWSGSRGGVIGLMLGLVIFAVFAVWKKPSGKTVLAACAVAIACMTSFFVMPKTARNDILSRSANIVDRNASSVPMSIAGQQGRLEIWRNSIGPIAKNPFGYGLGYHEITDIHGDGKPHRVAHNTILEILLTGGIALFALCATGFVILAKRSIFFGTRISKIHYVFFGLVGTLGSSLFLDSLLSRWIWVAIGIVLAFLSHPEETPSLSDAPARLP